MHALSPVVQPFMLPMLDPEHDLSFRCAVAAKLVRDQHIRRSQLLLQQLLKQPLGRLLVASALHEHVEHYAVLVYRPSQPALHARDLQHNLVQMPFVANPRQAGTDQVRECSAELERPLPHGFMADDDVAVIAHPGWATALLDVVVANA